MTIPCKTCGPSLDCVDVYPPDVYSLEGPLFGFILVCPPGEVCNSNIVTFVCCGQIIQINIPNGTTPAKRTELINDGIRRCVIANLFCGGDTGLEPETPPGEPPIPPPPPTRLFYSHSQVREFECEDGGTFHFFLRSGTFVATTQEEADALALAFAFNASKKKHFCLNAPPMCGCTEEESIFSIPINGGSAPFSVAVVGDHVPDGMTVSIVGHFVRISGTPVTPGTYHIRLNVTDSTGSYLIDTVTVQISNIGYSAPINLGFTAPAISATTFTSLASTDFALNDILHFSRKVAGITTEELGSFQITALDTPLPGLQTITNLDSPPGTGFVIGDFAYWDLLAVPAFTTAVPYSFQLPVSGGSGTFAWTSTGTFPFGLAMSPSGLISGTPSGDPAVDCVVSVHDEACEFFPPVTEGVIYWGIVNSVAFDPSDFASWPSSKVTSLLQFLEKETGPYRTGPYHVLNPSGAPHGLAWFVVPDDYDSPLATNGFQWAIGNATVSTDNVMTAAEAAVPDLDVNRVANNFSPENTVNGWKYFSRIFAGVAYRFYVFGQYQSFTTLEFDSFTSISRTGGVASINTGSTTFQVGTPNSKISGIVFPGFDENFIVVTPIPFTPTIQYPNAGLDFPLATISQGSWFIWTRGQSVLNGQLGALTITLFVVT